LFQKIASFIVCLLSAVALLAVGFLLRDNPLTQFEERATGRYVLLVRVFDQKEIIVEELHVSRLADGDYQQEKESMNEEIRFLKAKLSPHEFKALLDEKSIQSVERFVDNFGLSPDQLRQLSSDPFYKDHIEVIRSLYNKQFDSFLLLPSGAKDPLPIPKLW
jgi:hypothetical protein